MNIAEALSLCTAHAKPTSSLGGLPGLTCQDLMFALGKAEQDPRVTRAGVLLVRLKHLGEDKWRKDLECGTPMLDELTKFRAVNDRKVQFMLLRALIHVAIEEYMEREVCPWCRGQKSVLIANKPIICDNCKGDGDNWITDRWRADRAGMTAKQWDQWDDLYHRHVRPLPRDLVQEVLSVMHGYLGIDKEGPSA